MNNSTGWIKLHRALLESPIFDSEKGLKIWIWCLLRANHSDNYAVIGRQKILVKKGQFIMGGIKAEGVLKIARTTIYNWLEFLRKEGMVDIKKTNKYTIITISKWENFQMSGHQIDIKLTSKKHQIDTNKNVKNEKNVKKDTGGFQPPPQSLDKTPNTPIKKKTQTAKFIKPTVAEVEEYCKSRKNGINAQGFIDKYEAIGWVVGKARTPMKDWKATIRTWENYRKENKFGQVLQSDQSHTIVDKMNSKIIKA